MSLKDSMKSWRWRTRASPPQLRRDHMSQLFDDICRTLATPMSRSLALKLVLGLVAGAILAPFGLAQRERDPCPGEKHGSCPPGQFCCFDSFCCPQPHTCCGHVCCPPPRVCIDGVCVHEITPHQP